MAKAQRSRMPTSSAGCQPVHLRYRIEAASERLDRWIEREGFKGYEPHDALNSPGLHYLGAKNRLVGVAFLQALRRCPVNPRAILGIRKDYNPKGMGLFLASYIRKYEMYNRRSDLDTIHFLAKWLKANAVHVYSGCCWGYNFDWPNRRLHVREGTPTIVNTAYVASAFLDRFDSFHHDESLAIGRGCCEFILRDLNVLEDGTGLCFSYTPLDERYVYNASLLGAVLLARVYSYTKEPELLQAAQKAARFVAHRQRPDGSWAYGENRLDGWVDSFHTGFILTSFQDVMRYSGRDEFMPHLEKGYRYYKENFFLPDGTPKYYPRRVYPADVHSAAQAILTFLRLSKIDVAQAASLFMKNNLAEARRLAYRTGLWTIENMQDEKGFFYYQIHRFYRIRIPYIRWGQAWMQRALTELLLESLPIERGLGSIETMTNKPILESGLFGRLDSDTTRRHSWISG